MPKTKVLTRKANLDHVSTQKAVEFIVQHTADGIMDTELRVAISEVIYASKTTKLANIADAAVDAINQSTMMPHTITHKMTKKKVANREYLNLIDKLYELLLANQNNR
jgi:hypothetical protein